MKAAEQVDRTVETKGETKPTGPALRGNGSMEPQTHCAYNQTRECFLGLEVRAADLPSPRVGELVTGRPLKSGEGVWLMPFRGIQPAGMSAPLDLLYLDENCRVIDMVESFPTFQVSAASPRPMSVLALPAHSIYSSQTQLGDQLVLCVAEEMERQLQKSAGSQVEIAAAPAIAGAALLREKPLWSGGPGLLELDGRADNGKDGAEPAHEMDLTFPGAKTIRQLRNWLGRWWSPDPRKAPRVQEPGLAAYYWNGSLPEAKAIRDISSSGLYLVTEERWYPGTLVLMTLHRTNCGEEVKERSIAVQSRAVRWGADGVGLQFVLADDGDPDHGKVTMLDAAGRGELERFLGLLKNDESETP